MGNEDGMMSAFSSFGQNKVIHFKDAYFSFAFGNEIALVISGKFWILNCGKELWEEVKEKMKQKLSKKKLIEFWKEKSKEYEISDWSADFKDLK